MITRLLALLLLAAPASAALDSDGDGVPDAAEVDGDSDEDGIPNYLDEDDDEYRDRE